MSLHEFSRIQERLKAVADPVGFLTNLFAHAPVGFAVWHADGTPLLTNAAFMEMFRSEPPAGYNVLEDDVLAESGMLALFQRAFAGETVHVPTFWYDPRELKTVAVSEGRRLAMSMTIFPLFKEGGAIDFVAATYKDDTEIMRVRERLEAEGEQQKRLLAQMERDISERQRLAGERAQLEAQLRQSQKMEALGTLSGGIAHDFNNLLMAILGHARLARDELPAGDAAQASLAEIHKAGLRASELVAQILAFGRPQEPRRRVVRPQPVVEEALRLLRASLPAMVEIRQDFAADVPPIEADLTQVHQAIMNLATNAAHAMGERGGSLDVRLGVVTVTEDLARASADLREGRYVVLSVADGGCGIERSILPRIFEPFFTTKGPGRGSGLGLSVVHGIMKAHEGAVTVYSEPGKGTTFRLYFPAAPGGAAETKAAEPALLRGKGEHILHVDDEEALGFLLKRLLERLGYRVTGHLHPEQALQDFRSRPQAFDAVITDHAMPTMSGVDLAKRILQIRADIPVVMMSGYFRPGDEEAARRAGIRALLLKPGSLEELGQVLHQLLDRA